MSHPDPSAQRMSGLNHWIKNEHLTQQDELAVHPKVLHGTIGEDQALSTVEPKAVKSSLAGCWHGVHLYHIRSGV